MVGLLVVGCVLCDFQWMFCCGLFVWCAVWVCCFLCSPLPNCSPSPTVPILIEPEVLFAICHALLKNAVLHN